jgi:hypothetical protein
MQGSVPLMSMPDFACIYSSSNHDRITAVAAELRRAGISSLTSRSALVVGLWTVEVAADHAVDAERIVASLA